MTKTNPGVSIGELARQTGVQPSALRYYESLGILPVPQRVSGQRRYAPGAIDAVRFIQTAQCVGFTLNEIKDILENPPDGKNCRIQRLQEMARKKIEHIDALIQRATAMKKALKAGLNCQCSNLDECLLFASGDDVK